MVSDQNGARPKIDAGHSGGSTKTTLHTVNPELAERHHHPNLDIYSYLYWIMQYPKMKQKGHTKTTRHIQPAHQEPSTSRTPRRPSLIWRANISSSVHKRDNSTKCSLFDRPGTSPMNTGVKCMRWQALEVSNRGVLTLVGPSEFFWLPNRKADTAGFGEL